MDDSGKNEDPQPIQVDQPPVQSTEQKPSSYFDRLRAGLIGQRRARRTFVKPR